jgi:hypothetical protein
VAGDSGKMNDLRLNYIFLGYISPASGSGPVRECGEQAFPGKIDNSLQIIPSKGFPEVTPSPTYRPDGLLQNPQKPSGRILDIYV